ncbi:UNVERIFIED_CONTAM: hypothetical protein Sradi_3003800 [Sesamum radiatum]|uniref:Cupin type-1 domain-containing protein n=1 Tax=Sesamum radiatum TaxID=300843 RepID=A0AAW2S0T8_SESRA
MELDLTPKLAKKLYGGDGGAYYAWCPNELPMLREGNIGAAKLVLEKNGFALPRYSDSAKVAYVLQGRHELVVLFLGDTSKAHKSGSFTDFFLTGSNGIFTGFSTEFVSRAWDLEESVVKTLVGSQSKTEIVKLDPSWKMPEPRKEHYNGMALNCEEAPLDVDIKDGGKVVVLNTKNLPLVGEVGLGADLVRLNGKAMCSPGFSCDSALQSPTLLGEVVGFRWLGLTASVSWKQLLRLVIFSLFQGSLLCLRLLILMVWIGSQSSLRRILFLLIWPEGLLFGKHCLQKCFRQLLVFSRDVEQKFSSKRKAEEIFFPPPN